MKTFQTRILFDHAVILFVFCLSMTRPLLADDAKADIEELKAVTAELDEAVRLEEAERLNSYWVQYSALVAQSESLIGISAAQVDDVLRSHLGLAEGKGVLVTEVADGSPAKQSGIQTNDVLVTLGDQEIAGVEGLNKLLEAAGEKATAIGVIRSGRKQTVVVTPKSAAAAWEHRARVLLKEATRRFWLGVGLATADETLRSHLGIADGDGLVVTGIEENSPAAKAGVMVNDVLLKLNGKALTSVEALAAQLQEIGEKSANLDLLRRGKPATLTVTPERRPAEPHLLFSAVDRGENDVVKAQHQLGEWLKWRLAPNRALIAELRLADQQKPDLAKQIGELLEQSRQMQKSLEALDAAIKSQSAAPAAGK
jgi:C-terminal processing protease CtpA/Prc